MTGENTFVVICVVVFAVWVICVAIDESGKK